jgi:integral membrane sensor domain MASE1
MRADGWPTGRTLLTALLVGVACYAGALVGTSLRFPQLGTPILFPAYAVLAATLILAPPRHWWIYLLAAAVGTFWLHVSRGATIGHALLAEVAHWSRALLAAVAVRRFVRAEDRLATLRSMSIFLLVAGVVAPLVGAFLGAGVGAIHHGAARYWPVFRTWLLANSLTG